MSPPRGPSRSPPVRTGETRANGIPEDRRLVVSVARVSSRSSSFSRDSTGTTASRRSSANKEQSSRLKITVRCSAARRRTTRGTVLGYGMILFVRVNIFSFGRYCEINDNRNNRNDRKVHCCLSLRLRANANALNRDSQARVSRDVRELLALLSGFSSHWHFANQSYRRF